VTDSNAEALFAYSYNETDEWSGGIVFSRSSIEARRIGANLLDMDETAGLTVHRRQDLDQYADTGVPARVLVEEGWYFECYGCGLRINDSGMADMGLPMSGIVGKEHGAVYCSHACRMESRAEEAAADAFGKAFLDMLQDVVRRRFPGAEIHFGDGRHHVYVPRFRPLVAQQAIVEFDWPGQEFGRAALVYHHAGKHGERLTGPVKPEFSCCNGDHAAFEAFAASYQQETAS